MARKDDAPNEEAQEQPRGYVVLNLYRCQMDPCRHQMVVESRDDRARFARHMRDAHGVKMED